MNAKPLPPPGRSLLSGLNPNVSAFGKGQQMQSAAELGVDRAQKQQEMSLGSAQSDIQRRMQSSRHAANRFGNEAQERTTGAQLDNRRQVFDMGMNFDYAALQRRNALNLRQSLFNNVARDF